MSGIYIPNTKPPTTCCACPCSYDNQCAVNNKYPTFAEWYEDKPKWCPLIPVPDHGRLIDGDALREDWLENGENEYVYDTNAFLDSLDDAPTIIPADKEAEG